MKWRKQWDERLANALFLSNSWGVIEIILKEAPKYKRVTPFRACFWPSNGHIHSTRNLQRMQSIWVAGSAFQFRSSICSWAWSAAFSAAWFPAILLPSGIHISFISPSCALMALHTACTRCQRARSKIETMFVTVLSEVQVEVVIILS